ncbi:MAG: ABC transporter permease subunit [Neomegalonema sp.]|nr:ABC transporter permease subunit [Neomegalonema sp.]
MAADHRTLVKDAEMSANSLAARLYDPRWRGAFIQAIVILLAAIAALWLLGAALSEEGGFGLGFLFETSRVKIEPGLGGYVVGYVAGQSKLYQLFFVGLINAVSLAVAAIIAATLLGAIVGVFRLLPNFVLSGLAAIYVELFRNLPVLLLMLTSYALMSAWAATSSNGTVDLLGLARLDGSGLHMPFPEILAGGSTLLLMLTASFVLWRALRWWKRKRKDRTGEGFAANRISAVALLALLVLSYVAAGYEAARNAAKWYERDFISRQIIREDPRAPAIRFTSAARVTAIEICGEARDGAPRFVAKVSGVEGVTEIVLGRYHRAPSALTGFAPAAVSCAAPAWLSPIRWPQRAPPTKGAPEPSPAPAAGWLGYGLTAPLGFLAAWLGLTLYAGAYIGEITRAAVLAINPGQIEAARALGMQGRDRIAQIIAPQALPLMIPPIVQHYRGVVAYSSLASAVGYSDIVGLFSGVMTDASEGAGVILIMTLAVYLTMSHAVTLLTKGRVGA